MDKYQIRYSRGWCNGGYLYQIWDEDKWQQLKTKSYVYSFKKQQRG